jgi:phytoene synthase
LSRATNFYYSFLVLPAAKRDAIVAVWDFCRAVDDAVDEAREEDVAAAVEMWRREVAACFEGVQPVTPQGRALAPLVAPFNLPRHAFDALVEGVAMDVGSRRYETFDELYEYCIRVASAVGLMCLEIFGYDDPRSRQYATELGIALQLTNILRDVAEDLGRGRVYIPQQELRHFGVTEADLEAAAAAPGRPLPPAVHALLKHQAGRARDYYVRAAASLPSGDARRLVAAEIMGAIYFAILEKIERAGYDVFTTVARIPRPRRVLIAAGTWLRVQKGDRPRYAQTLLNQ